MEEPEVARDDEFVDKVDPDPGLSGKVGVGRYHTGFVLRIGVFKELEDDMRVVKGFPLIRDGGDESSGVESYISVVRRARGGRDIGMEQANKCRDAGWGEWFERSSLDSRVQGHSPSRVASLLKGLISTYLYGIPRSSRATQHFCVNGQNFWGAGGYYQMREIKADGGTYPTTIQDEFAVGLVIFYGLCSQTCGTRVKLEDVGRHGSMGGRWGWF